MNKKNIFSLKSADAYLFKVLAEFLKSVSNDTNLKISKDSICITGINRQRDNMIIFNARRIDFTTFSCKERKHYTIPQTDFHQLLKSTRRKDSVYLSLSNDATLTIIPIRNDTTQKTTKSLELVESREINITVPYYNENYITIVTKGSFQRMLKDIQCMGRGKYVTVIYDGEKLIFKYGHSTAASETILSESTSDDVNEDIPVEFSDDEEEKTKIDVNCDDNDIIRYDPSQKEGETSGESAITKKNPYIMTYYKDSIIRLTKLTSSSKNVCIFISRTAAIKFRFYVLTNATIDVSIKSKEIIEEENSVDN